MEKATQPKLESYHDFPLEFYLTVTLWEVETSHLNFMKSRIHAGMCFKHVCVSVNSSTNQLDNLDMNFPHPWCLAKTTPKKRQQIFDTKRKHQLTQPEDHEIKVLAWLFLLNM